MFWTLAFAGVTKTAMRTTGDISKDIVMRWKGDLYAVSM